MQNSQTLRGYIFRILQHFATNLGNFNMLFRAVGEDFSSCLDQNLFYNANCPLYFADFFVKFASKFQIYFRLMN